MEMTLDQVPNAADIEAELRAFHTLMPIIRYESDRESRLPVWLQTGRARSAEAAMWAHHGTRLAQYEDILNAPIVSSERH
jgi:hypothetical protein